jgi:hypothetical protein
MNKYFKEVITKKALEFKLSGYLTGSFGDSLIENEPGLKAQFKNVCAPIPLQLNEELENMLGLLQLTKRDFFTMAITSAIDEAKSLMDDIDITEYMRETSKEVI